MQNQDYQDKNMDYYTWVKSWMLPFIKEGPNIILDLGCAAGLLGKKLLESRRASELYGVELFQPAAEEAMKYYKHVYVGDVEELQLDYRNRFDYVICGDILEHLKDPYKVTKRIFDWLKPGGSILACIPNVRHYLVLGNLLLRGRWEYQPSGILDRTHLRFFTRRSCGELLQGAGFNVYHEHMIVYGPRKTLFNRLTFGLFQEFLATQTFCCGTKPARSQNNN